MGLHIRLNHMHKKWVDKKRKLRWWPRVQYRRTKDRQKRKTRNREDGRQEIDKKVWTETPPYVEVLERNAKTGEAGFGQKCLLCYHRHKNSQPQGTQCTNRDQPGPNLSQGNQSIKIKESLKCQQMEKEKKGKLDGDLAAVLTSATVDKSNRELRPSKRASV